MSKRRAAPPLPKQKRDGSRVWRTKTLLDQVEWFDKAAQDLAADCAHVIRRAVLDHDDGTSGGNDVKVAGGRVAEDGSENGRTPSMVLARMENGDDVTEAVARLVGRVIVIRDAMHGALADAAFLRGLDPEKAKRLVADAKLAPGAGWCDDCGRWVSGGQDRLRSGFCDKCRKRRERATDVYPPASPPGPSSPLVIVTRKPCSGRKWSAGVEVACTRGQGHPDDHAWPDASE